MMCFFDTNTHNDTPRSLVIRAVSLYHAYTDVAQDLRLRRLSYVSLPDVPTVQFLHKLTSSDYCSLGAGFSVLAVNFLRFLISVNPKKLSFTEIFLPVCFSRFSRASPAIFPPRLAALLFSAIP